MSERAIRVLATKPDRRGEGRSFERFVAAAHACCTLGEIADVLRAEFGVYEEPKIL